MVTVLVTACIPAGDTQDSSSLQSSVAADYILLNGRIYTVEPESPWVSAVAVRDDQFVYAGDDDGAAKFIDDDTVVTDLDGRLVLPGMVDAHTHPGYIDLEQYGARLNVSSHEDLISAVKEYADEHPEEDWIRLCCWSLDQYINGGDGPHKRALDAVVPDRPVWITSTMWHSAWLNSKALEVLGISESTADPGSELAEYVRDENGELTGWVKEGAGWQHFATEFAVDAAAQTVRIEAFLQTLSEHGVTTVYDGGNFGYEDHVYGFLAELEREGKLPLRYEGTYQIFVPERRHLAVLEMKRLRSAYGGERLQFRTIKLFMDGILDNHSAALSSPYIDDPDQDGGTMLSVTELRDFLLELHDEKFDLHVHAIGDRAVRNVLDAVEEARASVRGEFYPRVTLAHLNYVVAEDLPRFAELGVSANFTPWWFGDRGPGNAANIGLGPDRVGKTFLAKTVFDAGGNVTFSSDEWGLDVLSPFLGMQVGHNRQRPDPDSAAARSVAVLPPESARLSIESMIEGYTINGAWPFRMEEQIGSIKTGKLADLVVLGDDLFDMDRYSIHEIKPIAVMMEGQWIYGKLPVTNK